MVNYLSWGKSLDISDQFIKHVETFRPRTYICSLENKTNLKFESVLKFEYVYILSIQTPHALLKKTCNLKTSRIKRIGRFVNDEYVFCYILTNLTNTNKT